MEENRRLPVFGNLFDIMSVKRADLGAVKSEKRELLARDEHQYDCDGCCLYCREREDCHSPFKERLKKLQDEESEIYKEYTAVEGEYYFIREKRRLLLDEISKIELEIKKTQDTIKDLNYTKGVLESQLAAKEKELRDFESSH